MSGERARRVLLVVAVVVLGLTIYKMWPATTSAEPAGSPSRRGGPGQPSAAAKAVVPDVHLRALDEERPKPAEGARNLFRFKPKPPPAPPRLAQPVTVPEAPTGPPPPPPLAPIALKFIGVLEQGPGKPVIAVLSDSKGNVFHGVEGETIEGRYKILRVGVESIEMSYLDGRGRQTIRLTG